MKPRDWQWHQLWKVKEVNENLHGLVGSNSSVTPVFLRRDFCDSGE